MKPDEIRARTRDEDTLLGNRTTSFLLGNGFILAALGLTDDHFEKCIMAILGVALSLVWFLVAFQSRAAITELHKMYEDRFPDDELQKIVFKNILWRRR
ncbi:MAG: hypothetical protein AAGI34_16130, partial [Pseudomonadota bacterium]